MPDSFEGAAFSATELAAGIVAAYVSHNSIPVAELPALIASVDAALRRLAGNHLLLQCYDHAFGACRELKPLAYAFQAQ